MADSDGGGGRTAIVVAVISVIGVLGAAIITRISAGSSPAGPPSTATALPLAGALPHDAPPAIAVSSPTSPQAGPNTDSASVTAISPRPGSALPGDIGSAITMDVHYKLLSATHMLLVPTAEYYPGRGDCTGPHTTIGSNVPQQVALTAGEGDTRVVLNISADTSRRGSVSARASFWSGFDDQNHVIVNVEQLWDPQTTCFSIGGN